jgi:hypothetical protein
LNVSDPNIVGVGWCVSTKFFPLLFFKSLFLIFSSTGDAVGCKLIGVGALVISSSNEEGVGEWVYDAVSSSVVYVTFDNDVIDLFFDILL